MSRQVSTILPSVNFHLWEPCNMRCKFCFATFQDVKQSVLPIGHLPREQANQVVKELAALGFEKITFAGGEPTLCPWLPELIRTAKDAGMTTMIVTNGSKLSDDFLKANQSILDWIAVSVDSLIDSTNITTGRTVAGRVPLSLDYYVSLVDRIKANGYRLKVNTVVSRKNYQEDMSVFISYAKPERWKVLQVLAIEEQNDSHIQDYTITNEQFELFLRIHRSLEGVTRVVAESDDQIKGSYAMVDPAGRFFDNVNAKHHYSSPILEIGGSLAVQQVSYDLSKFTSRGGFYDWRR